jgi:hypothetical protein
MDIVGYTLLPTDTQSKRVRRLQALVRTCPSYQSADAAGQLIKLPRGDGMALVFLGVGGDAVRCAIEIGKALAGAPDLRLRMGIHCGEILPEQDMNGLTDVAGDGINFAYRAMEPGDHGHILVTVAVAEWLAQHRDEFPQPHDLGKVRAKHGVRMHLYNLYGEDFGNEDPPQAVVRQRLDQGAYVVVQSPTRHRVALAARAAAVWLVVIAIGAAAVYYGPDGYRWGREQWLAWRQPSAPVAPPARTAGKQSRGSAGRTARKPGGSGDARAVPDLDPPILSPTIKAFGPDGAPLVRGKAATQSDGAGEPVMIEVHVQPRTDRRGRRTITLRYSVDGDSQPDPEPKQAAPDSDPAIWSLPVAGDTLTVEGQVEVADGDVMPFGPLRFRLPPMKRSSAEDTPD